MGHMFVNVTGQAMIMGSGIGSVTLISQAFGAKNYVRCGDILQRQLAIHAVIVLGLALLWIKAEDILVAAGQPDYVAARTAEFVRWRLAALPCTAIIRDWQSYLLAQRIMMFPMIVGVTANLINVALFALLIPYLGFIGAPIAITLSNMIHACSLSVFSRRRLLYQEAWPQWNLQTALNGWIEMLAIGLPAGALQLGEWWAWELNLFFAGLLCPKSAEVCTELDVFPICSNTMVILFQLHNGFNLAAGTLVGNALGAGDHRKARKIAWEDMVLVATLGGVLAIGLYALRHRWGLLFVDDDDAIIHVTCEVLPWVAVYVFVDSLGPGALVNILRNAGVVRIPELITYSCFYLLGVPCGLALTFPRDGGKSWGVVGLWIGLVVGLVTMVTSLLLYVQCFVQWHRLAEEAQARSTAATVEKDIASTEALFAIRETRNPKDKYHSLAVAESVAVDEDCEAIVDDCSGAVVVGKPQILHSALDDV